MSHSAIWDRAWYVQTKNPRDISVSEALKLRDEDTLKSGDLFCCAGGCRVRLGARRPYIRKTRTGFTPVRGCFRRLPGPRKIKSERSCSKHISSERKGETWKHARVLSEITNYLKENSEKFHVEKIDELGGLTSGKEIDDEADLLITHSKEIIEDSPEIRLICRFQNMRRANRVIKRHFPNIIFIDMHRWRDADIDFIKYIHERVDEAYERLARPEQISESDLIHRINYTYPNLGLYEGGGLGFGQKGTILLDPEEEPDKFERVNSKFERLLKSVEEHNYWAINQPGCQKYHLKHLHLGEYNNYLNLFPGGDNENENMFPKPISIMMQEHIIGHWSNYTAFVQLLNQTKADEGIIEHYATLEGDGQRGNNNLPIGLSEALFLINVNEVEAVFSQSIKSEIEQYSKNISPLLERERKKFLDSDSEVSWNSSSDTYSFDGLTKKLVTPEDLSRLDHILQWYYHLAIPELLFWNHFDDEQKQEVFAKVKQLYRKFSQFRGRLVVMPLVDIELDSLPKTLMDPNKIFEFISIHDEEYEDGKPLSVTDYFFLKWTILADEFYGQVNAPIIKEIILQSRHSTDDLVTEITLEIPLRIEKMFTDSGNLDSAILDKLLELNSEEE